MMACKQATALLSARSLNYGGMISVFGVMIFLFYLSAFADVLMSVCRRRQQTNWREYFIVYLGESMIQKKASQW